MVQASIAFALNPRGPFPGDAPIVHSLRITLDQIHSPWGGGSLLLLEDENLLHDLSRIGDSRSVDRLGLAGRV